MVISVFLTKISVFQIQISIFNTFTPEQPQK